VSQRVLCAFLNTETVDRAFRCLSGSVAVSAYELEALPLPPPDALRSFSERVNSGANADTIEAACSELFVPRDIP
jgi:adenine-specific DNA-methyltransferase